MSTTVFVPEIWSASVLRGFEKTSVFASAISRDYAGELSGKGDTVKIPRLGPISIKNYTRGGPISYDDLDGSTLDIAVDQEKYWALKCDDADAMQSAVAFLDAATQNAAYALRDVIDTYTAGILTDGAGTKLFTATPYQLGEAGTAGGAEQTIRLFTTLSQRLDELNIPRQGRWLAIPPYVSSYLTEAIIKMGSSNQQPISESFVTRIAGFDIYMSNNLTEDADGNAVIVGGISKAATHIMQISKVEKLRDQASFSDLVRGLAVYVSAVLLPEGIISAVVEKTAV